MTELYYDRFRICKRTLIIDTKSLNLFFNVNIYDLPQKGSHPRSLAFDKSETDSEPDLIFLPCLQQNCIYFAPLCKLGQAVANLIEALCYKPEGRGFDSR
jgi:hypothetical protein